MIKLKMLWMVLMLVLVRVMVTRSLKDRTNLGKVNNAMIAIMISMLSADLGHTADCSNSHFGQYSRPGESDPYEGRG